jgi:hypothetical protein
VPEEVTLQELIAKKDKRIRELEADKQQQAQEIKLLKESSIYSFDGSLAPRVRSSIRHNWSCF